MTDKLIEQFYEKAEKIDFNVTGLLLGGLNVLTLGSDSKLIGRIFELLSTEVLMGICKDNNWILEETESQTVYPDFTIIKENGEKIAVDIKTTYRKYNRNGETLRYSFTLGSYASFLRNNIKNIAYPYDQYAKHYVIGFVYDRNPKSKAGQMININEQKIEPPFTNVEYFIQEKYKSTVIRSFAWFPCFFFVFFGTLREIMIKIFPALQQIYISSIDTTSWFNSDVWITAIVYFFVTFYIFPTIYYTLLKFSS